MRPALIVLIFLAVFSCQKSTSHSEAETIINKAIEKAGGDIIDASRISFKFRDKYYSAKRQSGDYSLERCTDPQCMEVHDILTNNGFLRKENQEAIDVPDSMKTRYGSSVNSVHYFSVLPYSLDAAAVKKEKIGETNVKNIPYHLIKVTFQEEGGGEDFQDEYLYWINKDSFTVDYLAYNYQVAEGGTRFREAYNPRVIEGVRFVDYRNYKPKEKFPPLKSLDSLFLSGNLELISKIELEEVSVNPCPNC